MITIRISPSVSFCTSGFPLSSLYTSHVLCATKQSPSASTSLSRLLLSISRNASRDRNVMYSISSHPPTSSPTMTTIHIPAEIHRDRRYETSPTIAPNHALRHNPVQSPRLLSQQPVPLQQRQLSRIPSLAHRIPSANPRGGPTRIRKMDQLLLQRHPLHLQPHILDATNPKSRRPMQYAEDDASTETARSLALLELPAAGRKSRRHIPDVVQHALAAPPLPPRHDPLGIRSTPLLPAPRGRRAPAPRRASRIDGCGLNAAHCGFEREIQHRYVADGSQP